MGGLLGALFSGVGGVFILLTTITSIAWHVHYWGTDQQWFVWGTWSSNTTEFIISLIVIVPIWLAQLFFFHFGFILLMIYAAVTTNMPSNTSSNQVDLDSVSWPVAILYGIAFGALYLFFKRTFG